MVRGPQTWLQLPGKVGEFDGDWSVVKLIIGVMFIVAWFWLCLATRNGCYHPSSPERN